MHVEHFEKNIKYTDEDLLLVAKKLGKLATYCKRLKDESSVIRIEAERRPTEKRQDQVKVMISVVLPKKQLRAESRRASLIDAIDRAVSKLEPQLKKYKDFHTSKGRVSAMRHRRGRKTA